MAEIANAARIDVTHVGAVWLVRISGVIDERFSPAFADRIAGEPAPVVIDLDGVTRISSFGVREWMRGLKALPDRDIYLVRCRPVIVGQLNSVADFAGGGRTVTFYCPYACPVCGRNFDVLVDLRRQPDVVATATPPAASCPSCGAAAAFDDLEDAYFTALAMQPALQVPADVESAIDGRGPTRTLRVHKQIEGNITGLWLQGTIDGRSRLSRYAADLEGKVAIFLGGADVASDEAIARLREVTEASRAEVYLVDVPLALALRLLEARAFERAHLVSVVVVHPCPTCGAPVAVAPAEGEAVAATCRACNAVFEVAITPRERALTAALPTVAMPDDLRAFAASHAAPQPSTSSELKRRSDGTPGTRVGRYEIVRRIGMGGMAEVLLGRQHGPAGFEKKVVVKRILPHLAAEPRFIEMFLQEARLAARIVHSNVVQIYDLGRDGDDYFIVMEYIDGFDFSAVVKLARRLQRPIPIGLAGRVVADCCAGLHAAHSHRRDDGSPDPILHRDVSPHNIMIGFDGTVRLTDFGIAKASDQVRSTDSGLLKGKLVYMAPEQLQGSRPDLRSDVFAAALVLYVALTFENPFQRATEIESMKAIMQPVIPPLREKRSGAPPELEAILVKGLAEDPAKRYQSAEEMQLAIERFLLAHREPSVSAALARWLRVLVQDARSVAPERGDAEPGSATLVVRRDPGSNGSGSGGRTPGDKNAHED